MRDTVHAKRLSQGAHRASAHGSFVPYQERGVAMGATVYSMNEFVKLETLVCGECGVTWAMPAPLRSARLSDGKSFFCPNGHERVFRDTEEARLRRALDAERRARERSEELRKAALKEAEHNAIEWRKSKTRLRTMRERVKHGVCPCCKRSFVQLARHMATQHPDFNEAT